MDALLQIVTLAYVSTEIHMETLPLIFDGMLPLLTFYLNTHVRDTYPHNHDKLADLVTEIESFTVVGVQRGLIDDEQDALVKGLLNLAARSLKSYEMKPRGDSLPCALSRAVDLCLNADVSKEISQDGVQQVQGQDAVSHVHSACLPHAAL